MRYWISFLLGFALAGLAPRHGFPHGPAQWIANEHATSPQGVLCCGEEDCGYIIEKDAVHATQAGYEVHGTVHVVPVNGKPFNYRVDELVPYSEAQPSPTGEFWRCAWPTHDDRKCFFAPPPGS